MQIPSEPRAAAAAAAAPAPSAAADPQPAAAVPACGVSAVQEPVGLRESPARPRELGGPAGPEPTRYGDWEHRGRCIDF